MDEIYRGSEWRKWDLHFHTPSSYDYGDKSVTNEEIIETLFNNQISVVAITDHHVIDVDRIKKLQELGKAKGISVLPGIEFLSDAKGKVPIHFIGIFDENCNIEYVWGQLENTTNIKKIKGAGKEHNQVYCDLEDTIKIVKELGGITTIHAGEKSNSIENITHSLPHGEAQKTEIANIIDFYELGKVDDKEGYINIVFPAIKKHIPMIIASDNHNIKKYILKETCWIKADKTFEGLRQAIYEPKERVRIQANKPQEKAGYQSIDNITISHSDFAPIQLHLNQNLNTIIGGRSTGKSILLGAIAKKLNSDKEVKFENDEYAHYVSQIVSNIKVVWKDGIENNDRNIEYFPQSYMHRLAKNINNDLDNLIEEIITQDEEKRNEIYNYDNFSKNNNTEIVGKVNKLFQTLSDYHKLKLTIKELGDEDGINSEKIKLTAILEDLRRKIQISQEDLETYKSLIQQHNENLNKITAIEIQILKLNSIKIQSVSNESLEFEFVNLLEPTKTTVSDIFKELKVQFQKNWTTKIGGLVLSLQKQVDDIKLTNTQIVGNPIYIQGVSVFNNNQQYKEIEEKLKIQNNKLFDIENLKTQEKALTAQYSQIKDAIKQDFREYYNKIVSIQDKLSLKSDKLEIKARATFIDKMYREILNSSINQQSQQGQEIVNKPLPSVEDFFSTIFDFFDLLLENKITLKGGYTVASLSQKILSTNFFKISYDIIYEDVFKQMSEGKKAFVVLMLLLDFSTKDCPILIDQPEDDLDNRAIYNELVTYIKGKKKERQIIVVTHNPNIVVGADSELVIVSNQHGINSPNKSNFKFAYVHGSLEMTKTKDESIKETLHSQGIRQHVCEILEGGFDAFKQRELKYNIH